MKDDQQANWQYSPEGSTEPADSAADPAKGALQTSKASSESVSWTASEYIDHQQGLGWFMGLAAITAVLAVGVYFLTGDYFGTATILLLGLAVGIFAHRTPKKLAYELSADGLKIGQRSYPFNLFKSFSLIQDGVLTSIDLMPIKRFMPPVSAYFAPADQEKIIKVLEDHLPYEDRQLDKIERLTRSLHF